MDVTTITDLHAHNEIHENESDNSILRRKQQWQMCRF